MVVISHVYIVFFTLFLALYIYIHNNIDLAVLKPCCRFYMYSLYGLLSSLTFNSSFIKLLTLGPHGKHVVLYLIWIPDKIKYIFTYLATNKNNNTAISLASLWNSLNICFKTLLPFLDIGVYFLPTLYMDQLYSMFCDCIKPKPRLVI